MDFRLSSDQLTLATEIDKLAAQFETKPTEFHGLALVSQELDTALESAEFFDIAQIPELGPVSAALAVERLARLPYTAEIALSMLVRPQLRADWPRPLAMVENGQPGRFVAAAKTLLVIEGDTVAILQPAAVTIEPVESLFAYPMGKLKAGIKGIEFPAELAAHTRTWIRVALAAEISGLLQAAIGATVEHLSVRKQFGRPLGTFQALRHRLAECAVLAGGVRLLALKAASTGTPGDAALAALQAQETATRVVYEVHQMHGAMGVTLEHPLHLWTYRLKALLSALGGRTGQANAAAEQSFDATGS
jgi:hypothetical protein